MALASNLGKSLIAAVPAVAPGATAQLLRLLIDYSINGLGKLPGARVSAAGALERATGDFETAITNLTRSHVALGGAQGFVTNLGGLATAMAAVPANLAGITIVQSRLVASIVHLRGYDVDDPRVRSAIVMTLLGRATVHELIDKGELPATPMAVATAPAWDSALEQQIAEKVVSSLMAQIGGKQAVSFAGKRVPVIGGGFGGVADGYSTLTIGRYARQEFVSRRPSITA